MSAPASPVPPAPAPAPDSGPARTPRLPRSELADYVMELGGTLLSYGCPTHRLEAVIRAVGVTEGYRAEAFALPTGLFVTIEGRDGEEPLFRMVRVQEWAVDLDRLALVDRIFNDVADDRCTIEDARHRLHDLETRPRPYPRILQWVATAGAAGAAAVFFRGGAGEAALASAGGLVLGALATAVHANPRLRLLTDFLGGLVAAIIAWVATAIAPELSREVVVLSIVIPLVPGMSLTTGLAELAHKNLVSGAGRVMDAFTIFLSILSGIALVVGLERMAGTAPAVPAVREGFGLGVQSVALAIASLSFGVIFLVPRRLLATALASGGVAWVATAVGNAWLPAFMAAFVAALLLTLSSNAFARITQRPAQVFLMPGLVLLVPGSFGFLSLESFLRGEFLGGAAKGFEMFLIGGALVTGLLVANVLLPARKIL